MESSDRHFLFSLKVCMNCQQNGLDNSWKAFPTVLSDRVFVFLFLRENIKDILNKTKWKLPNVGIFL